MGRVISAVTGIVVLVIAAGFWRGLAFGADPVPPKNPIQVLDYPDFQKQIQPFFNKYCIECHSAKGTEPDIRFDLFTDQASLEKWTPMLEKAVTMLREQKMPPKRQPQPTREEHDVVLSWLQAYTSGIDCSNPALRTPGRVTIRRLNRAEYNNTIRDLLAMDFQPANAFPADDAGYGFDNNGDVLSIAPVLMEKYLAAAAQVMDRALFCDPIAPPPLGHWVAATMEGSIPKSDPAAGVSRGNAGRVSLNGRVFEYGGEIHQDYDFPADGEYLLQFRGYGRQRPTAQFMIDGENVAKPITPTEDQQNTKVYPTTKLNVSAGKHRITLVFANGQTKEEYDVAVAAAAEAAAKAATQPTATPATAPTLVAENAEDAAAADAVASPVARPRQAAAADAVDPAAVVDPTAVAPPAGNQRARAGARGAGARGARGGARGGAAAPGGKPVLGVVYLEAEGPLEVTPDRMPESYSRVMVARPSATVTKPQAAEQIIRNFASKAFRRPVLDGEVKSLMEIWSKYDASGETFDQSIATALQAVLVSPYFIYRYEQDPGSEDAGGVRTINEYELASRLSYFLWSSMPDDELIGLAAKGQLRANLDAQLQRMVKDPKSRSLVDNFAGQWLRLRMMDFVTPDAKTFPDFDDALRQAMITETQMFFLAIMQEDRSILDFIDADFTFLNERLAKHYGIEGVTGDDFRRVKLSSPERGGLLAQGSVLTITSYPARTSPVQRGKWVLDNLLDKAPPPPPPDVPALKDQVQVKGTLRQRMEQHRSDPACATCHEQMDAIGFGLENFDAVGAWRTSDGDAAIDPTGSLPGGQKFSGVVQLKQVIKAHQDEFCKALVVKMLTYSLGRGLEKYDQCTVDEIVAKMKQDGFRFSVLMNQIVHSDPFQKRASK